MFSLVSPAANSENVLIANLVYTNIIYNAVPFYKFEIELISIHDARS